MTCKCKPVSNQVCFKGVALKFWSVGWLKERIGGGASVGLKIYISKPLSFFAGVVPVTMLPKFRKMIINMHAIVQNLAKVEREKENFQIKSVY